MAVCKNGDSRFSAHALRLLRLLSKAQTASVNIRVAKGRITVVTATREHAFSSALCEKLQQSGCIELDSKTVSLTPYGKLAISAALQSRLDKGLARLNSVEMRQSPNDDQKQVVAANINESPLSRLYKFRKRDGTTYISDQEFMAGERLRSDFHKAGLGPKISANWSMTAGHAGKGGKAGASEVTDIALDARSRFHNAMDKIGPELAGVVTDICCFLKGLETVERERQWPPRSAKLMLKTALGALARHYGLSGTSNRLEGKLESWSTADSRPSI